MMRLAAAAFCSLVAVCLHAEAPPAADPAPQAATLDTVLVTGEQPGPGLWKVTKGDHVLWILGTQYPLPRKMTWRATEVEAAIAQSQEVIADATAKVDIGFFRMLTLVPAVLGARKNPDHETLAQILPPDLYARWSALKAKYIGRDRGVENLRPMVAADKLYDEALDKSGLVRNGAIWDTVQHAAKKHRVHVTEPEVTIPLDDPKQAIQDFKSTTGDRDVACLAATITRLETDLEAMRQRANAWAIGDIQALQRLPYPDQRSACLAALESNERLHAQIEAAKEQVVDAWLAAAEKALASNLSTFAVLPMGELLAADGRLERLRSRGYAVEAPE
ncbi:MAG TPA: TraB/GumN family protein [Rudaea sp.]|nr:TraB/GumN family protein [Rudaea sp.]